MQPSKSTGTGRFARRPVARELGVTGKRCGLCRRKFRANDPIEIDHIVPKSWGGTDIPENLQKTHRLCNIKKPRKYLTMQLPLSSGLYCCEEIFRRASKGEARLERVTSMFVGDENCSRCRNAIWLYSRDGTRPWSEIRKELGLGVQEAAGEGAEA